MKRQVKDLIAKRGLHDMPTVTPNASIFEALNVLTEMNCSALLVVENGQLRGIFSEKDFARATIRNGLPLSARVDSIMTVKVYFAEPNFTLEECLQIMSKVHIRHLPVLQDGRPIALVSDRPGKFLPV